MRIRHLIRTTDLQLNEIEGIFRHTDSFSIDTQPKKILENKRFITIFFENSTRTLSSFEIAIKNLGGEVIRLDVSKSSTSKGESIADTAATLNAMQPHGIITRHNSAGASNFLARFTSCPIINGGDGAHAHPTQALLDLYTIRRCFWHKQNSNNDLSYIDDTLKILKNKRIAIVGDIKNSRVANSNIELLSRFGVDITLVAPPHFLYKTRFKTSYNLHDIIDNIDILMSLRTQTERHNNQIYGSLKDYANRFCITKELLGDRDIIVLHPGPVHRNIDIDDYVLSDSRCKVLQQVGNGVKIRMAIMSFLIHN
ncbi:aspartate carbamoyltransferase catalytic subunit [Helicobacter muridarum]|uniref:Aspartate carbamoyltransferase n=1 Tax=Helicobacter muridarum TaxID=216 RepID=A0A099TWP1_9HELI|nr:aspartate carbamoyltransferase catalytic subunit [Helicobacter muridarum]TLE00320.1 aspartate carbamoyltransferase catalytic subunit [Helicobacter muridarum]STQ85817.1 aspartate carbamoyltransferase [Helicobacter muridarum]